MYTKENLGNLVLRLVSINPYILCFCATGIKFIFRPCAKYLLTLSPLPILGYTAHIFYPKRTDQELFSDLVHQAKEADVIFLDSLPEDISSQYSLVVDAIFGFSFKPPVRPLFMPILESLTRVSIPLISVDIPSGWDVEAGPPEVSVATPVLRPDMLVSLTAPKLGSRGFSGAHYLGGRFVPRKLAVKYNLNLPEYPETDLVVKLKDKEHKEL